MKLLFLTGSRGEWGYIRPILKQAKLRGIDSKICATNMHLLPSNGYTLNDITSDGYEVDQTIHMALEGGNHYTMTKSLGIFISSFVDTLARVKPDWLVLAGDRGEQMMGAIAAAYTYTPVAHIQAGEVSGNIDGLARHAMGKFVHLHFAANEDAGQRLLKLGEQDFRIHVVGAPQLDELVEGKFTTVADLQKKLDIDLSHGFLLVAQHPVTEEYDQVPMQIDATLEAVSQFKLPKIWIMPNNDAGAHFIRDAVLRKRTSDVYLFDNLLREDYIGLMKSCTALVGNSSSGLLEAPSFATPAVNLGRRQANRVQGKNVINAQFNVSEIVAAVQKAISPNFKSEIKNIVNPYGDGKSAMRILDILSRTPRDQKLLTKELTY